MEALARSLIHAVPALGGVPLWAVTTLCMVLVAAVVLTFALTFEGFASYILRKAAADIQARIGPNRVGP
ncbi:MAG TPA: NADH-quinone oxidoreductase subunit H, partial [Candidatus Deferrimicrobiaceae bacterium]